MAAPPIQTHAFWFFGVLVGLGVKEILTSSGLEILTPEPGEFWSSPQAGWRLAVCLTLGVRLLFGAAVHFNAIQDSPPAHQRRDFLSGAVHFVFFVFLCLSAQLEGRQFLLLLAIVLAWDFVWWGLCAFKVNDQTKRIRHWMLWNIGTLLLAALLYLTLGEFWALGAVVVASVWDIISIYRGDDSPIALLVH